MVVLDGNLLYAVGLERITPKYICFLCMPERTNAITNEVLEPITFVLAYRSALRIPHKYRHLVML